MILAIDQGTTNTKVVLVDKDARIVASASRAVPRHYPEPGWVEQDARQLWTSVDEAVGELLTGVDDDELAAVAVTNQRESVVVWDRGSEDPVGPCISWQCRRTADLCGLLRAKGAGELVAELTGLPLDPLFTATKAAWLLGRDAALRERAERGQLALGTIDSWLVWQLTAGAVHTIEMGNASRTQMLNIHDLTWDQRLLEAFDIPAVVLPSLSPSVGYRGETAGRGAVPAGVPILAVAADSHAALFGQGCTEPGEVKATYGTGTSIMTPSGASATSSHGLATTIAWQRDDVVYAREANITATGATIDWVAGLLGVDEAADVAAMAEGVEHAGGVHLVPAFAGLGAPHWDEDARALISDLTFGTSRPQLARAAMESIAFQVRDVLEALAADGVELRGPLRADGGASRNRDLMQFQADIIGRPVAASVSSEMSVLGVAVLAGRELGWWSDDAAASRAGVTAYEPSMGEAERERRYAGWMAAVARASSRVGRDHPRP